MLEAGVVLGGNISWCQARSARGEAKNRQQTAILPTYTITNDAKCGASTLEIFASRRSSERGISDGIGFYTRRSRGSRGLGNCPRGCLRGYWYTRYFNRRNRATKVRSKNKEERIW